jgi:hypothetical protein
VKGQKPLENKNPKVIVNENPRVTYEPINVTYYVEKMNLDLFIPLISVLWEMNTEGYL